jgi:hypothetical protein
VFGQPEPDHPVLGLRSILFTSLLCLRALAAASQGTIPLQPGTRVHVTSRMFSANPYAGPTLVTATFVEMRNDSLFLQLDRGQSAIVANGVQPIGVPVSTVTALSVRQGKRPAIAVGAAIGLAVGLVGGLVVALHDTARASIYFPGTKPFGEAIIGGAIGCVVGAGVGSLFHADRWVPIPTDRLRVAVRPSGGLGGVRVGLRVAF